MKQMRDRERVRLRGKKININPVDDRLLCDPMNQILLLSNQFLPLILLEIEGGKKVFFFFTQKIKLY